MYLQRKMFADIFKISRQKLKQINHQKQNKRTKQKTKTKSEKGEKGRKKQKTKNKKEKA